MLSSFSPPSSPYSGWQGLLFNSFSIELTVQCDGCLIWGLGWRAGLVAGLRVGQAYGGSHRPGFGLLGSVPRSLSTQPPFVTQALSQRFLNVSVFLNVGTPWRLSPLPCPSLSFHCFISLTGACFFSFLLGAHGWVTWIFQPWEWSPSRSWLPTVEVPGCLGHPTSTLRGSC